MSVSPSPIPQEAQQTPINLWTRRAPERPASCPLSSHNDKHGCAEFYTMAKEQEAVVDIGINLTNRAFKKNWRDVVQRAVHAGVDTMLLTGTSIDTSQKSSQIAQTWFEETGRKNLYFTVGVHPHDAKTFGEDTIREMKDLLEHPLAVAVGECGLDYNRNFSPKSAQIHAFREQARLACQLQLPMFVHERDAHDDLIRLLDETREDDSLPNLPPVVVHCSQELKKKRCRTWNEATTLVSGDHVQVGARSAFAKNPAQDTSGTDHD